MFIKDSVRKRRRMNVRSSQMSTIKRKTGALDSKRGKVFTKII
jgi:transcriptional/translational regulatory protein YebC/TACO1